MEEAHAVIIRQLPPLTLSLTALLALGCASQPVKQEAGLTAEQQAAYDQCLQDNMAAAMAWEMIEQSCREQAGMEGDPPGLRIEDE